jgi:hypothetical protein
MVALNLKDFPMPPSINVAYANSIRGGRHKTQTMIQFERRVKEWAMKCGPSLQSARIRLSTMPKTHAIWIDRRFFFHYDSIITKSKRPRRNDTSNRIKALDDAISQILGIDDSIFWGGSESKEPTKIGLEYVDIVLSPINIEFERPLDK